MRTIAIGAGMVGLAVSGPVGIGRERVEGAPPPVQWAGARSGISEPGFRLIADFEAWRDLWQAHRGECAERAHQGWVTPPEVDFERFMVVACFRGEAARNNGERAEAVFRRGDSLVVRFDSVTFQTASFGDEPAPEVAGTPYGLWVVERFEGPVILEENRQGLIGGEPIWREAHRLGPLDRE